MFLTSHKSLITIFVISIAAIVTPEVFAKTPLINSPATAGQLLITEFRLRGPGGANDEFVEIYNNSGTDHTVVDSGFGGGYAIAASNGVARCIIPNDSDSERGLFSVYQFAGLFAGR